MSDDPRDMPLRVKDCVLQAVLGKKLGEGCFRKVYALDDTRVVKIETEGRAFCNSHEWSLWLEVQGTKWEKWFAPCLEIDAFGTALIQARTQPMSPEQWASFPRLPNFFADLKQENWGMLEGRPVCHDYGNHNFFRHGFKSGRLVKFPAP